MRIRIFIKFLIISLLAANIAGCSNNNSSQIPPAPSFQPHTKNADVSIVISCPEIYSVDSFLDRRSKLLSQSGVRVEFKYYPIREGLDECLSEALRSTAAGENVDAYLLVGPQAGDYAKQYPTADLSGDLSEYAPNLLAFYQKNGIAGPYGFVPIDIAPLQDGRYGIAVARELVEKYNSKIESVDDYYRFLDTIKNSEKGYIPGIVDMYYGVATLLTYSGYVDAASYLHSAGSPWIFFKPGDPVDSLNYLEDIPDCVTALWKIKQLVNDGTLIIPNSPNYPQPLASIPISLSVSGLDYLSINPWLSQQLRNMVVFPVEKELMCSATANDTVYSLAISPNSMKKDSILQLVDWIFSRSDNYMLAKYGEIDKEYTMKNSLLTPMVGGDAGGGGTNSDPYIAGGISWALRVPGYDPRLSFYPVNTYDVINTQGTSDDIVSRFIGSDQTSFFKLRDELNAQLSADATKAALKEREEAFAGIFVGKMQSETDLENTLSNIRQGSSLLDVFKNSIEKINEKEGGG